MPEAVLGLVPEAVLRPEAVLPEAVALTLRALRESIEKAMLHEGAALGGVAGAWCLRECVLLAARGMWPRKCTESCGAHGPGLN